MSEQTYTVVGMSCDHCARAVTDEVSKLDAVTVVDVDLAAGSVRVASTERLDQADIAAAVGDAGYEVRS